MEVQELVCLPGQVLTYRGPAPLALVQRPTSCNDVGVVAWVMTLKTPECPQGRQVRQLWSLLVGVCVGARALLLVC